MALKKTEEQLHIIQMAKDNDLLRINAVAGSGKTSTLAMVAEELELDTLLLVFNKAAQKDAEQRFPPNVETRTTHSMAYQAVGCQYQHKLGRPKGRYVNVAFTGSEIAKHYKLDNVRGSNEKILSAAYLGLLIRMCVEKFEQSADTAISDDHLPSFKEANDRYQVDISLLKGEVLRYAKRLWKERIDLNSQVMISHDTYMKLWQLSKPVLRYDMILLDEAQDTSRCVLDVFRNQEGKAKLVCVGDDRQSIYEWRGSVNAMALLFWPEAKLTTSFRFGQGTSDLASKILGGASIKSFEGTHTDVAEEGVVDRSQPYTVLYRTNANLIMDAVEEINKGSSVKLEIDVADFLRKMESCNALYRGEKKKIKHQEVLAYGEWSDLVAEAKTNPELSRIQKMVEGGMVWKIINALNSHNNDSDALVTFTSAHKSKGREWDQVVLADDYPSNYNSKGEWVGLTRQEANLLYVACTRGRKKLEVNETVQQIRYHEDTSVDVSLTQLGAGIPEGEVREHFGRMINRFGSDHRLEAYEDWLEHGEGEWEGEPMYMPTTDNMKI